VIVGEGEATTRLSRSHAAVMASAKVDAVRVRVSSVLRAGEHRPSTLADGGPPRITDVDAHERASELARPALRASTRARAA
jgi:hypothetical protein